ncbi:hypothetical protein V6N13_089368 [Hibiscus sabdariffa]
MHFLRLERVATPTSEEDRHIVKRSRGEGDDVMDIGVEDLDGSDHGAKVSTGTAGMFCDDGSIVMVDGGEKPKPSFHDILAGQSTVTLTDSGIPELES